MSESERFRLNEPTVIQEIIDGEAIIADLGRGFYYSLDGLGSRIWNALVSGGAVEDIIGACGVKFPAARDDVAAGIRNLLDRLRAEELLVPVASADGGNVDMAAFFSDFAEPYAPPVLSKYTDMEQLLLLDPIHEVDETGWPQQPATGNQ